MRKLIFTIFVLVFMSGCSINIDLTESMTDNNELETSYTVMEETTTENRIVETTQSPTCEEEPTSIPNGELTLMQRAVLGLEEFICIRMSGESEIMDVKALDEEYYDDYALEKYRNKHFYIVDLDCDGNDEVALYWHYRGKVIIFHEINGILYGYETNSRAMDTIYNDGVYTGGSGSYIDWERIQKFSPTEMICERIAVKQWDNLTDAPEGYVIRYRLDYYSQEITEEEFNQIMDQISNVEAVRYDYSRANVEQFVVE